jgi:hypothetical protein
MFLNDTFMHDRAAALASIVLKESLTDPLGGLFQRALQRQPTSKERAVLGKLSKNSARIEDFVRCARVVLNLNEVIYVD